MQSLEQAIKEIYSSPVFRVNYLSKSGASKPNTYKFFDNFEEAIAFINVTKRINEFAVTDLNRDGVYKPLHRIEMTPNVFEWVTREQRDDLLNYKNTVDGVIFRMTRNSPVMPWVLGSIEVNYKNDFDGDKDREYIYINRSKEHVMGGLSAKITALQKVLDCLKVASWSTKFDNIDDQE